MNIQEFISNPAVAHVVDLLLRVVFELIIFVFGVQLIKLVRKIIRKSMEKAKAEKGVAQFVDSFVKTALYVILAFFIASNLLKGVAVTFTRLLFARLPLGSITT